MNHFTTLKVVGPAATIWWEANLELCHIPLNELKAVGPVVTAGGRLHTLPLSASAGTVRTFRRTFTLEDAIGSHACSLEALPCV
jgi:hypothetical protein